MLLKILLNVPLFYFILFYIFFNNNVSFMFQLMALILILYLAKKKSYKCYIFRIIETLILVPLFLFLLFTCPATYLFYIFTAVCPANYYCVNSATTIGKTNQSCWGKCNDSIDWLFSKQNHLIEWQHHY